MRRGSISRQACEEGKGAMCEEGQHQQAGR